MQQLVDKFRMWWQNRKILSYLRKANESDAAGEYMQAIEYLQQALDIYQFVPHIHMQIAHTFQKVGKTQKAISILEKAAELFDGRVQEHIWIISNLLDMNPNYLQTRYQVNGISEADDIFLDHNVFDFAKMRDEAPENVLKAIISRRVSSVEELLKSKSNNPLNNMQASLIPFNPLLLCTAIATSIVKEEDFRSTLYRYVSGLPLEDLDSNFLKPTEIFSNQEQLADCLDLEIKFTEALVLLALEHMYYSPAGNLYFPESYTLAKKTTGLDLSSFKPYFRIDRSAFGGYQHEFPEEWRDFTIFHVYMHGWMLINTIYLALGYHTAYRFLVSHGMNVVNSVTHNVRETYDYELANVHKKMNEIMKSGLPKEEKRQALEDIKLYQKNLATLADRGMELYFWNPMEAQAKGMVLLTTARKKMKMW